MELDNLQQRWLAQDARLDEVLRINRQLWLRSELQRPRTALRGLRFGAAFEIGFAALCLAVNGVFLSHHLDQPRFLVPAVALHLWMVAAIATTVALFVKAGAIDYDTPVVEIQQRVLELRRLTLRSLRVLFVLGVPIWFVPFCIVAARGLLGIDLYRILGGPMLLVQLGASVVLAMGILWACNRFAERLDRSPFGRKLVRSLAGQHLVDAEDQLARLAAFEGDGDPVVG